MRRVVTICSGAILLALVLCAGPPVRPVHGFDAELLKMRLIPRESDITHRDTRLEVDGQLWRSERDRDDARQRRAMKVSQSYLSENLQEWVKDSPLERVERLRRTELTLDSSPIPPMFGREVDLSLRVSEQLRLRVSSADFQRDLLYDPVGERMWVDLFEMALPKSEAGLKLTNTYRFDNDSSNLILKLNRSLE